MLQQLKKDMFVEKIPQSPMGKYAHIIVIRETQSFPLFQTDGGLNIVRVRAGLTHKEIITRLVMFKRKQSSPERLVGRELLRRYGLTKPEECDYNQKSCKKCPDCIFYGFAVDKNDDKGGEKSEGGSEKSKVFIDSAYSITGYDESHHEFSFNALFEEGKMARHGETRPSFGEQDHVLPQVFFPSVITVKDATEAEFIYILNNILRTKSYGAQTTRTGKVENHVVGLVFADGEIFSNLKLTQAITDSLLIGKDKLEPPLHYEEVLHATQTVISELLKEDGVVYSLYSQEQLQKIMDEVKAITTDETALHAVLQQASKETIEYYSTYIQKATKPKKGKTGSAAKKQSEQSSLM